MWTIYNNNTRPLTTTLTMTSFISYTQRLGYPQHLATDALARLGPTAPTNQLLTAVMANADRSNIRPCSTYTPPYLLTQDSYRRKDGSSKTPTWVNFNRR